MRLHNPLQFAFLYYTLSLISTAFFSAQISLCGDNDAVLQLQKQAEFNYFFILLLTQQKTLHLEPNTM